MNKPPAKRVAPSTLPARRQRPGSPGVALLLDHCAQALQVLLLWQHPADAVLTRFFRDHPKLGPRERALVAETAYTVIRHKRRLEFLARSGSGPQTRRLAILGFAGTPAMLAPALSAPELDWLRDCQQAPPTGWSEPHRHNLPDWLAQQLQQQFDKDFWPLAQSLLQVAPLDLRVNTWLDKREAVQQALAAQGLSTEVTPHSPWGLRLFGRAALQNVDLFQRGVIEVQDEGSQLLALLVDAKRGEMVADFCAGAGGKTLALGSAMRNTGRLYAFDTSAHRLAALKPRLARSQLSNVHPVAIAHERDERIKRLSGKIDRVLVDAPCSGLGTLRRNPDLKWRHTPATVAELVAKQTAILASAARLLKPGGRLVYATCSLLQEENQAVAQAFNAQQPQFVALDVARLLSELRVNHATDLCSPASAANPARYLQLLPHRHSTDGFFAAVWQRQ